jgi:sugar phosphate isomerase/epimerase
MKVSCLPVSLFKEMIQGSYSIWEWADAARKIGLDGIDISIAMIRSHNPACLAELSRKVTALPIIMVTAYPDFTHPDPLQRRRELDYCKSDIALCSQLGAKYMRILAGQAHPETSRENGIAWTVENFHLIDNVARHYGIKLLYENHSKPTAWQYLDFSYPMDIFLTILNRIKDTSIRLNFDIGNIVSLNLEPMDILPLVIDWIETIHVSDMSETGKFSPIAIGKGVVPIQSVFSYLKQQGFNGWLCIEEASNQGLDGITHAVQYVQRVWRCA